MKKIIALLILMMTFSVTASAAETEGGLIQTTVRVNINEGTVTKNDEGVKITTAPYIDENGVSMMEFYTLAEAMGAEATDDGTNLKVSYAGVDMLYIIGSNEATIAGQKITMPSAPVRSANGVIMVPIRFISEALGADVTYDGTKGEIVIVSSGELDEGINFKLLFKYSTKNKIGHSVQKWRFTKTDNFDMAEDTYYSGYEFAMDDIMISLNAVKNTDNQSLDLVYSLIQQGSTSYYSSYRNVMYDKGTGEHNGVPYAYVKRRTVDTITEMYAYVTDEYIYNIAIQRGFESFATAKDSPDVNAFLESLEFNYTGGDEENTVDLVNVNLSDEANTDEANTESKEDYTDGNYSWRVKLNGTWEVNEYYGFYNNVTITRESDLNEESDSSSYYSYISDPDYIQDAIISITTLSNRDNQSVAKWAQEKQEIFKQSANPELLAMSDINDVTINGYAAKTFDLSYTEGEYTDVYKYYFLNAGSYRYTIVLSYDKREEEQAGFLESADAVIKSFTPGEINADEVGDALEADSELDMIDITSEFNGEKYKLSYPCVWSVEESESGLSISASGLSISELEEITVLFPQYALLFTAMTDEVSATLTETSLMYYDDELNKQNYTVEQYMKKSIASMLNSTNSYYQIEMTGEIENVKVLGRDAYKVELLLNSEDTGKIYVTMYYVPNGEESVITITKSCSEYFKNTAFDSSMDKAIESIKAIQ